MFAVLEGFVRAQPTPYLVGAPLLGSACQEKVLVRIQDPPSVTIQEPSDGSSFYNGQNITFKALVVSNDGTPFADMTHQWVSGEQTICLSEAVPDDGYPVCTWAFDGVGEHTVSVTITDPSLSSAVSTISVNIIENSPPTITITAPEDDALFAVDDLIVFEATVDDAEEGSDRLFVTVEASGMGSEVVSGNATSDGQYAGAGYVESGAHLVTMTVTDSYGKTAQDTVTIEVFEHGPPWIDTVSILPVPAFTVNDLSVDVQGWDDLEGSTPRSRYQWFISDETGKLVEDLSESTDTYPAGKTTKGDLVQVQVTPYNDYGEGVVVASSTVEIQNSAPSTPLVYIEPSRPQPSDNLYCFGTDSEDADGDVVSYSYAWYRNGKLTAVTDSVVEAAYTANGETWECYATPNDGDDDGSPGSDYVTVSDTVAPDAPLIDAPTAHRNEESVTLTGTCEAGCLMTVYCDDTSSSWSDTLTCSGDDTFSYTTTLTAGRTVSCYADCEDSAGNRSGSSNTVSTEVCDPGDRYEDSTAYGDDGANAIDEWSSIADDGSTTITIEANILEDDDEDWYLISASDDVSEDRSDGLDYYNFEIEVTDGTSTYEIFVYTDTYDTTDLECSSGATEYSDSMEDKGEGVHSIPSDVRSCADSSTNYNQCEDNSTDYYIQVVRLSGTVSSCQGYELDVTNGVW